MKFRVAGIVVFSCAFAGAVPQTLDIQGQIDSAPMSGSVIVPAGEWTVRPFRLKSVDPFYLQCRTRLP